MSNNYIFIVNPTSGRGKSLDASKVIHDYCYFKKVKYKIIYTKGALDATELAKYYSKNPNSIIYSVGGDGTLNEIINGIEKNSNLNVVPVGSGNDFYKSIKDKGILNVDIGYVNDKKFINVASIGLDAVVAEEANNLKKYNLSPKLIYPMGLVKKFFTYKGNVIATTKKNNIRDYYTISNNTILSICNGKYYGGGFKIGPEADLTDGMFDICELDYLNKLKTLKILTKLLKANHINDSNVNYYSAKSIIVDSKEKIPCNVDGEIIYDDHFEFTIKPNEIIIGNDSLNINSVLKEKKLIK